jgi:ribonuclease BN (tRNA processing enzyme)
MKLKFLGVGGAFCDATQYQSNCAIEIDDKLFLIDCGSDIRFSLKEQYPLINNGNISDYVKWVYISHLHGDHCHGLEWLGYCTYFNPSASKPILIGENNVLAQLWSSVLRGTMEDVKDYELELSNFFEVFKTNHLNMPFPINSGKEEMLLTMVSSPHVHPCKKSYGLFIETEKRKTYYTSDVNDENMVINKRYYEAADIIFHDCETYKFHSGVHAHYESLRELPYKIRRKIWLCHYSDDAIDKCDPGFDGFSGFCRKGDAFEL